MEEQLVRLAKKQLFWSRLLTIVVLLVGIGLAAWMYQVTNHVTELAAQADTLMQDVRTTAEDLDQVAKSLQEVDFAQLAENVNEMVDQSGEAMTDAMKQMDEALQAVEALDIEGLNAGISRFNSVVEPLARLFGK